MEFEKIKDFFVNLDFKVDIKKFKDKHALSDTVLKINGEVVYADAKTEVRPNHIPIYMGKSEHHHPNVFLLAADYITPKSKETLKSKGINYIDSYGNAFINLKNLKIFIEKGNAKPVYNTYSEVFTRAGGQILFHLLQNPEMINATYEHLADVSCVSLGTVGKTINGLFNEGYAVKWDSDKKYQLVRREELLEKWVTLLNEKILPSKFIGRYNFGGYIARLAIHNDKFETRWGGEYVASIITENLKSEKFSLFTNSPKANLMRNHRLIPNEEGGVNAYSLFWKKGSTDWIFEDENEFVHPLLIYAELIYSGNDRNIETAKIIFDAYIKPNL